MISLFLARTHTNFAFCHEDLSTHTVRSETSSEIPTTYFVRPNVGKSIWPGPLCFSGTAATQLETSSGFVIVFRASKSAPYVPFGRNISHADF